MSLLYSPKLRTGFSLVELSIVLVILGLLVGGILTGKTLIRASQMRALMEQQQNFRAATHAFKDKYFYFPGDLPNATQFWGAAATCGSNKYTTDKTTCDGDGDGFVYEYAHYWVHLSNAGLVAGQYCGVDFDHGPTCFPPADTNPKGPAGKIGRASWSVNYMGTIASPVIISGFYGQYGHTFLYPSPGSLNRRALDPQESLSIDTKIDDGKPATGKVVAYAAISPAALPLCTDVNSGDSFAVRSATLTANYLATSSDIQCGLMWREQF